MKDTRQQRQAEARKALAELRAVLPGALSGRDRQSTVRWILDQLSDMIEETDKQDTDDEDIERLAVEMGARMRAARVAAQAAGIAEPRRRQGKKS